METELDKLKEQVAELEAEKEVNDEIGLPLWERLPDRHGISHGRDIKLCRLLHCDQVYYAKGLCHKHYKYNLAGKLDPATGGVSSRTDLSDVPVDLPHMGNPDDWVFIQDTEEFVRKSDMYRLRLKSAITSNGMVVRSLITAKKFKVYDSVKFVPYNTGLADDEKMTPKEDGLFNMYQPGKVMWGKDLENSTLPPEVQALFTSLGGADSYYLERWLANMLRNPGKPGTALILKGMHGSGKGTLGTLLKAVYKDYLGTCSLNEIENGFSSWVENKLVMVGEEVSMAGATKQVRTMNELKKLMSGGPMFINRKMVAQYESNICARWLINSNARLPMIMEPTERRYWVIESFNKLDPAIGKKIGDDPEYYAQRMVNYLHFAHTDSTDTWEVWESDALKRIKNECEIMFK